MKKLLIFIIFILIFPIKVLANDFDISLSCPSTALSGENITCTLSLIDPLEEIETVNLRYKFINQEDIVNMNNEYTKDINITIPESASSNDEYNLTIDNVVINNINTSLTKTSIVRIKSNDNKLKSLTIDKINITFNKDVFLYDLSTFENKINISAIPNDEHSKVYGIGDKNLNYGLNTFEIKVISETLEEKKYILNINRIDNRSNNNYLSNITINNNSINFNKETTTYNITVKNDVEKLKINAILDDNKSSFESGYGSREVSLKEGNNVIYLKIYNEKNELRTYTLNINRESKKSSDSTLKIIRITDVDINFSKDVFNYKINVDKSLTKVKINAVPTNDKAKVQIDGVETLSVGSNIFKITVTAEDNSQTIYKVILIKKVEGDMPSSNNNVYNITIKNVDFDFDNKIYKYNITTNKKTLDISVFLEDENASYEIIGNENLKNNSNILIKVKAEDGSVKEYTFKIKKTTNIYIILLIIFISILTMFIVSLVLLNIKRKNKLHSMYKTKVKIIDEDFEMAI